MLALVSDEASMKKVQEALSEQAAQVWTSWF